jgi:hypothetical protein
MSLRIVVYSSVTTIDHQITEWIKGHRNLEFSTFYPGGLYGTCSFFVPGEIIRPLILIAAKRIEIFDGLKTVWEGMIENTNIQSSATSEGVTIECTGFWGSTLMRRRWDKIWCDMRTTQDKWEWGEEGNQFRIERQGGTVTIYPRDADFVTGDDARVTYTLPTGQTLAHITYNYDLFQGDPVAEHWHLYAYDVTNAGTITGSTVTASGTGSVNGTPSAGCTSFYLAFDAGGLLTANIDNGAYGKYSNIKVYTESGTISSYEIMRDLRAKITEVNSDESYISANGLVLEPFFMEWDSIADTITKVSSYGDSEYHAWAGGLLASSVSSAPNGYPVMYFEQIPGLNAADYLVRIEELDNDIELNRVTDEMYNYLIVKYRDDDGNQVMLTPEDHALLKDSDYIGYYRQRDQVLNLNYTKEADALGYAYRYLAAHKDPVWRVSGGIKIRGKIRDVNMGKIPVSWVRSGKRIMIENYISEIHGGGAIFLITGTSYDEDNDTLTIKTGSPDPLSVLSARMKRGEPFFNVQIQG